MAWPLILANSFWNIQLTVDRIFLGHHSTESLGAAMAVMGVFWVPMAFLQQTAAYVVTFVAQYCGAKKLKMIGPSVWQSIYFSLTGGLLFLGFIPLAPPLFAFFGHSQAVQPLEVAYFQAICYSALPTAIVAALSGFYTGLGLSQMVMWINGVGMVANVILDYILIFGHLGAPALGIAGAGYATAGANCAAMVFALFFVFSKKHQKVYAIRSSWHLNLALMAQFLRYGIPSGLQWALEGLAFTVFLIFIGNMPNGDAALVSSGIAVTILMLAVLPALGIGQATSALVGQHLGENRPQVAEGSSWHGFQIALIYIVSVSMTFLAFPEFYLSWFYNSADPRLWSQVATIVPYLLMFIAVFTSFDSINMVFSYALKGAGDTRFVTTVALLVPWPTMVLPTWLVSHRADGVYWAWAGASSFIIIQALIYLWRFRQGKWKSMRVI